MKEVLVFDVNETLLDLRALAPAFERAFGDAAVMQHWFALLLRLALVSTLIKRYHDFGRLAGDALEMTAERLGRTLSADERAQIMAGVRSLPPHPEVPAGLERLRGAGYRMATLTNSPPAVAQAQLENAGLTDYFERILSVDPTGHFKPAPQPYHYAAQQLGVAPGEMRLIAAHDWDVAGALSAGCRAAFIARPGMVLGSSLPRPDIMGPDLVTVAEQIIESNQPAA